MSSDDIVKSRLCDENRALIKLLNRHLTAEQLKQANLLLHTVALSFAYEHFNSSFSHAYKGLNERFNRQGGK